jgi:hypothetical protein
VKIKIGGLMVDVLDKDCAKRPCLHVGMDKGTYVQGRGYTSYYRDAKGRRVEYPVCMTRHTRGCPANSICLVCRTVDVRRPGESCRRCTDSVLTPWPLDTGGERPV